MAHQGQLPVCPDGSSKNTPLLPEQVHHKVVLTWNPSVPSGRPGNNPLGYCLYRSQQQIFVKELKRCKDCEQVTPRPLIGTGCVDPVVEDGKTYYYVAIAINPGNQTSEFSNQTIAAIPPVKESLGGPSSLPSCREPDGSQ
jgi:hypothetical protein